MHTPFVPFSNPTTSLFAAKKAAKPAIKQIDAVRLCLEKNPVGLTDEQIARMTGIGIRQASTRRNELCRLGLVADSGKSMKNTNGFW